MLIYGAICYDLVKIEGVQLSCTQKIDESAALASALSRLAEPKTAVVSLFYDCIHDAYYIQLWFVPLGLLGLSKLFSDAIFLLQASPAHLVVLAGRHLPPLYFGTNYMCIQTYAYQVWILQSRL